jgi:hypothetical protein
MKKKQNLEIDQVSLIAQMGFFDDSIGAKSPEDLKFGLQKNQLVYKYIHTYIRVCLKDSRPNFQ